MSSRLGVNQPPFELGTTMLGTDPSDGTTLLNTGVLGTFHEFPDVDYSLGASSTRTLLSGMTIKAIALRNVFGAALLPKRAVLLEKTAGRYMYTTVNGYARPYSIGPCVIVDPYLPSAGVADDDIFWGIYAGPAICLTPSAGADFAAGDIAVGDALVAATGSTSGNSTSGRVTNITLAGQTAGTAAMTAAINMLGWAMSARTTGVTNSDILVNLACRLPGA